MSVKTGTLKLDDILKYDLHPAFCRLSTLLKAGADALVEGDQLVGKCFLKVGSDWKLLDSTTGAALTTSSDVAICLSHDKVPAAVSADALIHATKKYALLVRGPALVHKTAFESLLPSGTDTADLLTALAAKDIRYVDETGLAYDPRS